MKTTCTTVVLAWALWFHSEGGEWAREMAYDDVAACQGAIPELATIVKTQLFHKMHLPPAHAGARLAVEGSQLVVYRPTGERNEVGQWVCLARDPRGPHVSPRFGEMVDR